MKTFKRIMAVLVLIIIALMISYIIYTATAIGGGL